MYGTVEKEGADASADVGALLEVSGKRARAKREESKEKEAIYGY